MNDEENGWRQVNKGFKNIETTSLEIQTIRKGFFHKKKKAVKSYLFFINQNLEVLVIVG